MTKSNRIFHARQRKTGAWRNSRSVISVRQLADLEESDLFIPGLVLSNPPPLHNPEIVLYLFLGESAYQRSYFSEEVSGSRLWWQA